MGSINQSNLYCWTLSFKVLRRIEFPTVQWVRRVVCLSKVDDQPYTLPNKYVLSWLRKLKVVVVYHSESGRLFNMVRIETLKAWQQSFFVHNMTRWLLVAEGRLCTGWCLTMSSDRYPGWWWVRTLWVNIELPTSWSIGQHVTAELSSLSHNAMKLSTWSIFR